MHVAARRSCLLFDLERPEPGDGETKTHIVISGDYGVLYRQTPLPQHDAYTMPLTLS